ncbi:MAG TPA: hypothetical protein VII06_07230 [Chloroflexota bacterium]|jgi:hypothetical protein
MITLLLIGAAALLLIPWVLAPLESLGWWAGWFGEQPGSDEDRVNGAVGVPTGPDPPPTHFLVYLSGIGAISGTSVPAEELPFLQALRAYLPGTAVIDEVFPYSVTNLGLTEDRALASLWRGIERLRLKNPDTLMALFVNLRNVFQVAVSADPRYGPIYNLGVAEEVWRYLRRYGYPPGGGAPVTLVGWSGGGQVAIGTATFLAPRLAAPLRVISLGGVLSDDPGLSRVAHLYHLYGTKDQVQALGGVLYAGRWPIMRQSRWWRFQAAGKLTTICLGPFRHNGQGNYFDARHPLDGAETYADRTLTEMIDVLAGEGLAPRPAAPPRVRLDDAPPAVRAD